MASYETPPAVELKIEGELCNITCFCTYKKGCTKQSVPEQYCFVLILLLLYYIYILLYIPSIKYIYS